MRQRWTCPNCSHANPMGLRRCGKCRFEPVGLDFAPPRRPEPSPPAAGPRIAAPPTRGEVTMLSLLTAMVAWLGWMAGTLPPTAREPFAVYLIVCAGAGAWIIRRRRRA